MVIEWLQLLNQVVQLDEGSERLALVCSVDGRGEELQHGVVLTVGLLTKLKIGKEDRGKYEIQTAVFPHANTHAVRNEDRSLELPSLLIKLNSQALC